ncbi:hypothetical protein RDABS01_038424, partial [Bienertia sinuspersici]
TMVANCACGLPVARRTSWTSDNPDLQRDVANMLVIEKHRLAINNNNILKSRLVCETYEKDRLAAELEKMKNAAELEKMKMKPFKQHETRQNRGVGGNEGIGSKFVVICTVVCVFVSYVLIKVFR